MPHNKGLNIKKYNPAAHLPLIDKSLERAKNLGVTGVIVTGTCEPLQHYDYVSGVLDLISNLRFPNVILQTSGYLLEQKAQDLKDIGFTHIALSLSSPYSAKNSLNLGRGSRLHLDIRKMCDSVWDNMEEFEE